MAGEIDELSQLLEQTNRELRTFNEGLSKNIRSNTIVNNALKTSTEATEESADEEKKRKKAISNAISGLAGFTKQLSASQGSFAPLTSVISTVTKAVGKWWSGIPVLGKALESVVTGAGEVTNFMIESFDKAYGTFEKLSSSGVVETFETMKMTAGAMNLNYSQTESVLSKHSRNLALFAGSALQGRKEFERLAYNSFEVRNSFQKLGISGEEFSDMQLNYINEQRLANRGQSKNIGDMTNSSIEYIKNLDAISKLTGMSRKSVQDIRKEINEDPRVRAANIGVAQSIVDARTNLLVMLNSKLGPGIEKGAREMLMSGFRSNQEFASTLRANLGNNNTAFERILRDVNDGTMGFAEALDKIMPLMDKQITETNSMVMINSTNAKYTSLAGEQQNARNEIGKNYDKQYADILAAQKQNLEDTTSVNAELANTKISLEKSQRSLEQLATDGSAVTWLMNAMAEGISKLTSTVYKLSGTAMPEHLKAAEEEFEAINEERKARAEYNKYLDDKKLRPDQQSRTAGLDSLKSPAAEKLKRATEVRAAATLKKIEAEAEYEKSKNRTGSTSSLPAGQPGAQALPGAGEPPTTSTSGTPELSTVTSKSGKSARVASQYAKNFQGLIDWFDTQGYDIKSMGGYNNRNIAGTNQLSYHAKGAAIDINPAENPMGSQRITDMPKGTAEAAAAMGLGWGLNWQNKSDAMHFSAGIGEGGKLTARTGGIFSGPESGYLAELHGTEAVVSADSGGSGSVSKQALGSGLMKSNSNKFQQVFSNLSDKMDTLIDLMDYSLENQKDFLSARLN